MCGIFAIYSPSYKVKHNKLQAGIDSLKHRGPDNQTCWLSADNQIGLAHARLSIIDLNTGEQPLSNHSKSSHLIANGEFYDFEFIREQLIKQGAIFKTASDSEIALHLYDLHGVNCLRQLRGEFAFCLWDSANKMLFAARDRFGINPLYYAEFNGDLYLASEIKALLAAGVPATWDDDSYFSRAFFYRDRSLFKGIHQVPPGHYLLATSGGIRIQKYWDYDYPKDKDSLNINTESASQLLREKLLGAVNTRLRSDVPVGVYLSGGVDSCAILGMASSLRQKPLDTFTLSFDDADYDEGAIARRMAMSVNANHHEISITQTEIADNFVDSIRYSENVCMNSHGVAKYLLSRYVRDLDFRVVLTGEGADEIFAGYPSFRNDLINQGSLGGEENLLRSQLLLKNKVSAGLQFSSDRSDTKFISSILGSVPSWITPLMNIHEELSDLFINELVKYSPQEAIKQFLNHLDFNQLNGINPVHAAMYSLSKSMMPNYVLMTLGDRMEMAHSIEGRVPFLDHQVVEFVKQLPIELKIHQMQEKYILREAIRPFVIEEVYKRQKHPFLAPPSVLDPKAKFYQLVQDTLRGQLSKDVPFFDYKKVCLFLDKIVKLPPDKWPAAEAILMELMSLTSLQYHFKLSA